MKLLKRLAIVLVVIALLSGFGGTLYYLYSKSEEVPVVYKTEAPAVATIIKKTVATGSVVPRKEVEIKPQVSGIVDQMFVEPGQSVKEGDLVTRIRIIPNMVQLSEAENRVNQALLNRDNARLEMDRNKRLVDDGLVSEYDYQQTVLTHDRAKEELAAAIDNLELIEKGSRSKQASASNTLVRATIAGVVLEVPLEIGDFVIESNTFNDGTTIATIADMDELIFEGKVDESEVGKLRPGMDLLLTIGAIEAEQFAAVLEHIAPKGIEENGAIQFEIRAALKLKDNIMVRANYSANADIVLGRRDNVLSINEALLQFEGDKAFVEVETGPQTFEKRYIETGLSDGINIEIVSGLTDTDKVKNPNQQS